MKRKPGFYWIEITSDNWVIAEWGKWAAETQRPYWLAFQQPETAILESAVKTVDESPLPLTRIKHG